MKSRRNGNCQGERLFHLHKERKWIRVTNREPREITRRKENKRDMKTKGMPSDLQMKRKENYSVIQIEENGGEKRGENSKGRRIRLMKNK